MTRVLKAAFITVSLAALQTVVSAAAPAQTHSAAAHSAQSVARPGIARTPQRMVATPLQPNFAPIGSVPGLGFSFNSLAATQRRGSGRTRRGQSVTPILWYSPFYSPYADYPYDGPQPPYNDQPPPPAQYAPPAPAPQAAPSEPSTESAELEPPPADVGQFVLVRLDGQVIFATAFTSVNANITYVNTEGIRRSFPLTELDRQATVQMNEANGSSVSLPD